MLNIKQKGVPCIDRVLVVWSLERHRIQKFEVYENWASRSRV